jgi:hypothetical protein
MPDDLRRALEAPRGPYRSAAGRDTDEGDLVIARDPPYHPDAAARAAAWRTGRKEPSDFAVVRDWYEALSFAGLPFTPPADVIDGQIGFAAQLCRRFVKIVWLDALMNPGRLIKEWPSAYVVEDILEHVNARQLSEIAALERMATAPRSQGTPCGSTAYRDAPLSADTVHAIRKREACALAAGHLADLADDDAMRTEQLAALRTHWRQEGERGAAKFARAMGQEEGERFAAAFREGINLALVQCGLPADFAFATEETSP